MGTEREKKLLSFPSLLPPFVGCTGPRVVSAVGIGNAGLAGR